MLHRHGHMSKILSCKIQESQTPEKQHVDHQGGNKHIEGGDFGCVQDAKVKKRSTMSVSGSLHLYRICFRVKNVGKGGSEYHPKN